MPDFLGSTWFSQCLRQVYDCAFHRGRKRGPKRLSNCPKSHSSKGQNRVADLRGQTRTGRSASQGCAKGLVSQAVLTGPQPGSQHTLQSCLGTGDRHWAPSVADKTHDCGLWEATRTKAGLSPVREDWSGVEQGEGGSREDQPAPTKRRAVWPSRGTKRETPPRALCRPQQL